MVRIFFSYDEMFLDSRPYTSASIGVIALFRKYSFGSFASLNNNHYQHTPQQLASAVLKERGKGWGDE